MCSKVAGSKIKFMANVASIIIMEITLRVIMRMEKEKDLELIFLVQEIKLKVNGMVMIFVKESYFTLTVKFMMVIFTKANDKDGANTHI